MRRSAPSLVAALIVLTTLAGCFTAPGGTAGPDAPHADARAAPAAWRGNLSQPVFAGVERSVHHVTSADGTSLSLTLVLPAGLPVDARVPTLLQITPYQGGMRSSDPVQGTSGSLTPGFEWFVPHGVAYVEADARGSNGSGGCLDFGGVKDREDARAFVDWIRAQSWSDGRVVTDGVSHPGMGSLVAHVAVPDLTAALSAAGVVSYYQDQWIQGAKLDSQHNQIYQAWEMIPPLYADPDALTAQPASCQGSTVVDFTQPDGRFTDAWAERDLSRHVQDARAPVLLLQGFMDMAVQADHFQKYWDALPEDAPKRAILGWWGHGYPDLQGHAWQSADAANPFRDVRHRWLDATLLDRENGFFDEPRVLVEDSTGAWHESHDWPLDGSTRATWHARADGAFAADAGEPGHAEYTDRAGARRDEWTDAHVAFRSEPFTVTRLVNGAPVVHLVAESSEPATTWVAYLFDEAPDGSRERVTHGFADSHTWNGELNWTRMEPGTAYAWDVNLLPTAFVVEEGHRLVLVIASQDGSLEALAAAGVTTECWDDHRGGCYTPAGIVPSESAGRAVNRVLTGPDGTRVTFDWVDPAVTAKPPW